MSLDWKKRIQSGRGCHTCSDVGNEYQMWKAKSGHGELQVDHNGRLPTASVLGAMRSQECRIKTLHTTEGCSRCP